MDQPPSQISGFYGPGAWAAWVITMIISWIPIIQIDYTHNLHFIGYALYTNWAAIDFISQMNHALQSLNASSTVADGQVARLYAITPVLYIGITQAAAQVCVCSAQLEVFNIDLWRLIKWRILILTLGLLLPFLAIGYAAVSGLLSLLPYMVPLTGILFIPALASCIYTCGDIPRLKVERTPFAIIVFTALATAVTLINVYAQVWTDHGHAYKATTMPHFRCFFVPCTPQSIGEWDQAFSLLVALCLFLYEFGPGMAHVARDRIQTVYEMRRRPVGPLVWPHTHNAV